MVQLAIMVAVADNGVIGRDNALPWHLPEDLRYFKRVTMGKPIIMGRKTFESIGRPLPGRSNIVVTRNPHYQREGVMVVASLDAALQLAARIAAQDGVTEMVCIGGAEIYAAALPLAQRLYLTQVHADVDGDAFLPDIDWQLWQQSSRDSYTASPGNPFDYSFVTFERA
tara:strand:- start:44413 stop:44919 length:507 start_codon:yes stop_codon:yes gene_type:complete